MYIRSVFQTPDSNWKPFEGTERWINDAKPLSCFNNNLVCISDSPNMHSQNPLKPKHRLLHLPWFCISLFTVISISYKVTLLSEHINTTHWTHPLHTAQCYCWGVRDDQTLKGWTGRSLRGDRINSGAGDSWRNTLTGSQGCGCGLYTTCHEMFIYLQHIRTHIKHFKIPNI